MIDVIVRIIASDIRALEKMFLYFRIFEITIIKTADCTKIIKSADLEPEIIARIITSIAGIKL